MQAGAGPTVGNTVAVPDVPPVPTTAPPSLAAPVLDPTPRGYVTGFTDAMNAGDIESVLANLNPAVGVLYFPGVAGIENPSTDEVRTAFEQYQILGATLFVDRCEEVPGSEGRILDCILTYNSGFARSIGLEDPKLFMRFVVGATGIDSMYLSPMVVMGDE